MTKLVNEEEIIKETRLDFEPKLSKWLIEQGFERELYSYSYPTKYTYKHKELPIKIEPRKEDVVWFGDYEIDLCEIIYAKAEGIAQLSGIKSYQSGGQLNALDLLEDRKNKMLKAFELAKTIVEKISKGDYE